MSDKFGMEKCRTNQGKNTFASRKKAASAADNLNSRSGYKQTQAYECKFCGLWHVGRIRTVEEREQLYGRRHGR